jgi:hypothetical protein
MSVQRLFALFLLPAGLLTTNITLGLVETETVPVLFLLGGLSLILIRGRLDHPPILLLCGLMVAYGFVGIFTGHMVDGVKVAAAAFVVLIATQMGPQEMLSFACRVSLWVLFTLRLVSLAAPDQFATFYGLLGLRGAETYGGTAAILFSEPSYLATAVFALWGIGRMGLPAHHSGRLGWFDFAAILVLALSFSVWAAIDLLLGLIIILRRRPFRILATGTALVAIGIAAHSLELTPGRLEIFLQAGAVVFESGQLLELALLDPSAAHRLVQSYLALMAAAESPFGRLDLELTPILMAHGSFWSLPISGGNLVALQVLGRIYASTVPLQLLIYGGLPLFAAFMVVVGVSVYRLWRLRAMNDGALIVIANIGFGCIGQSVLNSPFLYLCIAIGLFWTSSVVGRRGLSEFSSHADIDRHHQLQQAGGITADAREPQGTDRS